MANFKYIDSTDQPSDPNGSLGNLRRELRRAYNSNRPYTDKIRLLQQTLVHVVKHIELGFAEEALKDKDPAEVKTEAPKDIPITFKKPKKTLVLPKR